MGIRPCRCQLKRVMLTLAFDLSLVEIHWVQCRDFSRFFIVFILPFLKLFLLRFDHGWSKDRFSIRYIYDGVQHVEQLENDQQYKERG
jgi:hypothetical protein